MTVFARVGETVTCESGHPVCDVVDDIASGDALRLRQFSNWRGLAPDTTKPVDTHCRECGAAWIGIGLYGPIALHVGNEWRLGCRPVQSGLMRG